MADGTIDGTTIRMTYAELAAARSISLDAARRLVLRKRWPKQIGNDGLTRANVPAEYAEPVGTDNGPDIGTDDNPDNSTDTAVILADESVSAVARTTAALVIDGMSDVQTVMPSLRDAIVSLEAMQPLRDQLGSANRQIAMLTTRLEMAHERADRERDRADRAETRATQLQEQLQAEMVEHRRVVAELAEQLDAERVKTEGLAARRSWWRLLRSS